MDARGHACRQQAGGAWLPLEPFQEGDINAKIIAAVKPHLILCSKLYEKLPMSLSSYSEASMVVDTHTTAQGVASATNGTATTAHVTGADPAYIFFTSGSTGEPKGCINTHSAYLAALKSHQVSLAVTPNSRAMHNTSYCFDAFLLQTMLPLSAGACVCIPDEEAWRKNPTACLAKFDVTWAFFVPWFLVQIDRSLLPSLETVIIGVEGISQPQMTKWSQQVQLIHAYGLSECCVVSHVAGRMNPASDPRNVGVPGSFFHWIVDPKSHERLMPVGEVGELLLSGPSLGGGYLYQEQASKEAYVESPSWLPEAHRQTWPRLFKTQDLARYASDGSLVIIGRKNTLTNFNGHQVVMPELEHFMQRVILSDALLVVERTHLPALGSDTLVCFVGLGKSADGLMQQLSTADCTSITHMISGLSSKPIEAALPASITCTPSVIIPWDGLSHCFPARRNLQYQSGLKFELLKIWSLLLRIDGMNQPYIDFSATAASIAADAQRLVSESRRERDELVRKVTPEKATFANVMLCLAQIQNKFTIQANVLAFHRHVSTDAEVRAASANAQNLFDEFHAESWMREDIFKLVDAVYHKFGEVSTESSFLLETIHYGFTHSGLGLQDISAQNRLKEIRRRLSKIHTEYQQNLSQQTDDIFFTLSELEGVPESIIQQLENNFSDNTLRVDLSNPSHRNILVSATNEVTRQSLYLAMDNRCKENVCLLQEAVRLRYEMAKLLGFANYAALQMQSRMAKNPERVQKFLSDLQSKLMSDALKSLEELKALKMSDAQSGRSSQGFFLWDYDFYHDKKLKLLSSIDRTRIKEYFPLQTTMEAILNLVARLFGISFQEVTARNESDIWQADVQMFAVHDNEANKGGFLGYLYLDLFQRDGKYPNASCFNLHPGFTREDGTRQHPSTALLCTFSKPKANDACLLTHFEVTNLLHELGHAIHDLVSKTQFSQFHGPEGVPVDFGELPSQMLEYWCWIPSLLKSISHHYSHLSPEMLAAWQERNEGSTQPTLQIPDELIVALKVVSRAIFGPLFHLDQVHRANFDLAIHQISNDHEAKTVDITALWNKSRKEIGLIDGQEAFDGRFTHGNGYTTTTHLMQTDYASGYYGYL
ncbi:hypothetical protein PWT90_08815 [Aphanocladium album]|nr:hypothetical protein PWT90_08815 [Aphanocladium album]